MSYLIPLLLMLATCFGLQAVALKGLGGRTTKSESNFFSSIGRIQAGSIDEPDVMLLGSSITGRLPDRANGFTGFANMGCDGGNAIDVLRAMDDGILPAAPVIVIEANTLALALDPTPSGVATAMRRPWFKLGMKIQALSAYARPAAFAYSYLLTKKIGDFGDPMGDEDLGVTGRPTRLSEIMQAEVSANQKALIEEVLPIIERLESKGSNLVFVWLPPARQNGSPPPAWLLDLVSRSGSLWWDLGNEAAPGLVSLTDGVHMSAHSATLTMSTLKKALGGHH